MLHGNKSCDNSFLFFNRYRSLQLLIFLSFKTSKKYDSSIYEDMKNMLLACWSAVGDMCLRGYRSCVTRSSHSQQPRGSIHSPHLPRSLPHCASRPTRLQRIWLHPFVCLPATVSCFPSREQLYAEEAYEPVEFSGFSAGCSFAGLFVQRFHFIQIARWHEIYHNSK